MALVMYDIYKHVTGFANKNCECIDTKEYLNGSHTRRKKMPLRVVVVEDEYRIAELLLQLGHWEMLNLEVADVCYDGIHALESIQNNKPDIVLTDIRMPGCDGLELIQKVKELGLSPEFIITSGYRHFEYAKTAIQQGVVDYLLKPIDEETLNQTLEKACAKLRQQKNRETQYKHVRCADEMWRQLLQGSEQKPSDGWQHMTIDACNRTYFTQFVPGFFRAQYICTTIDTTLQENVVFREKIRTIVEKSRRPGICLESHFCAGGGLLLLLNADTAQMEEGRQCVSALLYTIRSLSEIYGEFHVTIGCSRTSGEISNLPELIGQARLAERGSLAFGTDKILEYDMVQRLRRFLPVSLIPPGRAEEIRRSFEYLQIEEIRKEYDALDRDAAAYSMGHPADMLAAQRELIRCSLDGTTAEQREKDELTQKILRQTAADGSFQELLRTTQELLLTFFSDYVEKLRKKQQRPVLEAKAYMDAAYGKDITLEQVAERVGLSPAYFSKVFKQETGQGFAEYLTQLRIAAAKKYLAETRESVKSIAALVGYQDEKYFSKVFKKAVGIKPTVYRSLYA